MNSIPSVVEDKDKHPDPALSFFPAQVATIALGIFGPFGLLPSITEAFDLASYTVSKRMRELSIRVALGAQAKQILLARFEWMLVLLGILGPEPGFLSKI